MTRPGLSTLAGLVAVLALALAACGDDDGPAGTPTAAPTATPDPRSPLGEATITVTPPPPNSEYRLAVSEFGDEADTIWLVNPSNPSDRREVVTIPHRPTFGIVPSLSPDGRLLAYLSLPPEAPPDPFLSRYELFLMDLTTGYTEKLLENVDSRFTPLWAPESRILYVRQLSGPDPFSIDVIVTQITIPDPPPPGETPTPSPTPSPTPTPAPTGEPEEPTPTPFEPVRQILRDNVSRVLLFLPIGFAADNERMYFVQIAGGTGGATLLGSYAPATSESIATATANLDLTATAIAETSPTPSPTPNPDAPPTPTPTPVARLEVQLSDQLITGVQLSPNKERLSFLAPVLVEGDVLERAFITDLANRSVAPLSVEGLPSGTHVNPVWHPDSERIALGFQRSAGAEGAVAIVPVTGGSLTYLPAPDGGFDEPKSWSPDGGFLAVEHHLDTGQARLDLVSPTGQRGTVLNHPNYRILGWYGDGVVPVPPAPAEG